MRLSMRNYRSWGNCHRVAQASSGGARSTATMGESSMSSTLCAHERVTASKHLMVSLTHFVRPWPHGSYVQAGKKPSFSSTDRYGMPINPLPFVDLKGARRGSSTQSSPRSEPTSPAVVGESLPQSGEAPQTSRSALEPTSPTNPTSTASTAAAATEPGDNGGETEKFVTFASRH